MRKVNDMDEQAFPKSIEDYSGDKSAFENPSDLPGHPPTREDAQKYAEIERFLSVEFEEDLLDDPAEEIRHSFCFSAFRSFSSSDEMVAAYASYHLGRNPHDGERWSQFELQAYKDCREDMFGHLPMLTIADHQGEGVAAMMHVRAKVSGAPVDHDWNKVAIALQNWPTVEPLPKQNSEGIVRRALATHFQDGPLAAGKARVAYYRWVKDPGQPVELSAYRWHCCEEQIREKVEIARSADIQVADFEGWRTSFAGYLPEPGRQDARLSPEPLSTVFNDAGPGRE